MLFELGFSMLVVSMNQPYYAKTDLTGKPEQTKVRKQIMHFIFSKIRNFWNTKNFIFFSSCSHFFSPHTVLVDCLVGLFMMVKYIEILLKIATYM